MRVTLLSGIFPPDIGGPATHGRDLAVELRARGHQVHVLTLGDQRAPRREPGLTRYPRWWPWPVRHLAVVTWLVRRRAGYDVVYATGLHAAAVAGARLARRPVVVKIVGDPSWERGRRLGLTDATFASFQDGRVRRGRLRAMRGLRNWTVAHATVVTVPSRFLQDVVRQWSAARPAREVIVVPNGVRAPAGTGGEPARRPVGSLHTVFVGRLVDHKRVDVLLDAVARVDGVTLEVIGDGPGRADLERRARDAGLDGRARFRGAVAHEEVLEALRAADASLTASAYEGLPHTTLEALVCGTPVVTSPVGGTGEVVAHEQAALVVSPPNADGFAAALTRLRDDVELRERLSRQAELAGRLWRFDRCADEIEALLERLTAAPRR